MLTWSGLRGAVGLAMAIVADEADYTSAAAGRQIVFFAGGVAFITVLVNGSSTHLLMRKLGMIQPTETEAILHGYVDATVKRRTVEAYESLAQVRTIPAFTSQVFLARDGGGLLAACSMMLTAKMSSKLRC